MRKAECNGGGPPHAGVCSRLANRPGGPPFAAGVREAVFSTVKELTMDMTTQIPALAQRGRAAINFQAGIGIAASRLLRQSEQAFQSSAAAAAPLPADMDERHAVVAGVIGDLPAFKVQSLLSEWRGRAHGAVAREAFEEVQDRIAPALHGLDSGPSTLQADPAFVAPAYWSETEFHRTAGGWDSSDYNGYIHGELLHRLMLAKMFPGDIFAQRRAVAQAAPRRDYARILDMGASSGHFTIALADIFPEARITGIDLSPRMLEHAMRTGNARGAAWHLAVAAAEDTGLPAESFDLVASYNLFHELTPPVIEAVMDEAFRLLAPGGDMVMADVPRFAELPPLVAWRFDQIAKWGGEPFWRASASMDLAAAAHRVGFVDVQAGPLGPPPIGHPYRVSGRKPG
jgi:SAM-dependent methyltransferase